MSDKELDDLESNVLEALDELAGHYNDEELLELSEQVRVRLGALKELKG